jgi:hypothetical protein
MAVQLRGNFDTRKTIRGIVLLPLTWLITCALLLLAVWGLSAPAHLQVAMWFIIAINFAILFFKLRLRAGTSAHWAYRILVSGVLASLAPGVATTVLLLVAVLIFGMPLPHV